jgi:hypothetical protein
MLSPMVRTRSPAPSRRSSVSGSFAGMPEPTTTASTAARGLARQLHWSLAARRVIRLAYAPSVGWVTRFRSIPPWRQVLYVVAVLGALALLIWDIADKGAQYTTVGVLVLVVIGAVALRAPTGRRN